MKINLKDKWLLEVGTPSGTNFIHRYFKEDNDRTKVLESLEKLLEKAHEDAKQNLENLLFKKTLDPIASSHPRQLPFNYPGDLHLDALKGYFGEIVGAYLITNESPFGHSDWHVPAFRFRMHNDAFLSLFRANQLGARTKKTVGLTGEDCIGFRVDGAWNVLAFIVGEAKCTNDHDSGLISEAHEHICSSEDTPAALYQLVQILEVKKSPNSAKWAEIFREIIHDNKGYAHLRHNMVIYCCGKRPIKKNRWIDNSKPHKKYKSTKKLEVVEVHLNQVDDLVKAAYKKK